MNLPTATLLASITDTPHPPRAKRFSIEEYHRLTEIGFFRAAIAWNSFGEN